MHSENSNAISRDIEVEVFLHKICYRFPCLFLAKPYLCLFVLLISYSLCPKRNLGKFWLDFEQNQNLASPKTFDLLRIYDLSMIVFWPGITKHKSIAKFEKRLTFQMDLRLITS